MTGGTGGDLSDDAVAVTGLTDFSEFVLASSTAPLPVELASFDVTTDGRDAILSWTTTSETNNAGFRIEKTTENASDWTDVGSFVEGEGTPPNSTSYRYRAEGLTPGSYTFRLRQINTDGSETIAKKTTTTVRQTKRIVLTRVHPNPVSARATLTLSVRDQESVTVELYNLLGQRVQVLLDETLSSQSSKRLSIDANDLSSGTYFLRIDGGSVHKTRKITVVR